MDAATQQPGHVGRHGQLQVEDFNSNRHFRDDRQVQPFTLIANFEAPQLVLVIVVGPTANRQGATGGLSASAIKSTLTDDDRQS